MVPLQTPTGSHRFGKQSLIMKNTVVWDVTPSHTAFFTVTAMKTSNLT
jgi:hypothetical protein